MIDPSPNTVMIALIGSLPGTLVAIVAGLKLLTKTQEIHVLINSKMDDLRLQLAEARAEIKRLEDLLGKWESK